MRDIGISGRLCVNPHDKWQAIGPEDQAVSGNLFPPILGLVGIGLFAGTIWALGLTESQVQDGISRCGAITNDHARLACYDKLSTPHPPARGAFGLLHSNPREGSQ
jgi:hypothetical protein